MTFLPLQNPQPIGSWTNEVDATAQPPAACALEFDNAYKRGVSEDCLYLNVYTKNVKPRKLCPVMVCIHGGAFMMGSTEESTLGPDFFMRKSVVLVTITYRLGALGFLSVEDKRFDIRGNAGLKDQSLGIRWIRDNIEAFGGDPENVTLFGGSAGGSSVHYHMLSDYSKGLFHKAIIQSGNAFSPWSQQPKKDLTAMLARRLGWNNEGGVDAMMAVILAADAKSIVSNQNLEDHEDQKKGITHAFVPCIEPYTDGGSEQCFVPCHPLEMAKTAWSYDMPLLSGCNTHEGYFFYREWKRYENMFTLERIFENPIPCSEREKMSQAEIKETAKRIQKFYYGDTEPTMENLTIFVDMATDRCFWQPTLRWLRVRERQAKGGANYLYRFCFDSNIPEFAMMKMLICGERVKGSWLSKYNLIFILQYVHFTTGTIHVEEMIYLFRQAFINYSLPGSSPEMKVIAKFVRFFKVHSDLFQ